MLLLLFSCGLIPFVVLVLLLFSHGLTFSCCVDSVVPIVLAMLFFLVGVIVTLVLLFFSHACVVVCFMLVLLFFLNGHVFHA